jgi:GTPase SAR1 family protein
MKDPTVVSRKLAVLGFRAVGKSSLTSSFVTGSFSAIYDPTIESTLHKTIRFRKVHFATDIVDTAGMVNASHESI